MRTDKIYVVGFMGSGKTTVARVLAKLLHWKMIDLDALIEAHEGGTPIAEIIRRKGMSYFRALETRKLKELLSLRRVVIATGGGAFAVKENLELMIKDGLVVWVYVPFPVCLERLSKPGEKEKRPLMQDKRKNIERLFEERRRAYGRAHIVVNGDRTPKDVVTSIMHEKRKHF